MDLAARQLLRAIRRGRSQVQFSRRLGYRSNVASDWEAGRRFPTGSQMLEACVRSNVDVVEALTGFHRSAAPSWSGTPAGLSAWLREIQGTTPQGEIAVRMGASRHQVGRWLSGKAQPRVPQLLALVDSMTGRVPDLVAGLVDIKEVPALHARWQASRRARALAWDEPWAMAVFMQIHVGVPVEGGVAYLSRILGIDISVAGRCLAALQEARLVGKGGGDRWQVLATPSVETPDAARHRAWVSAWSDVAHARRTGEESTVNLNVFSIGRSDLERIQALQQAMFRELRGIIASSEPVDTVALVLWQITELSVAARSAPSP